MNKVAEIVKGLIIAIIIMTAVFVVGKHAVSHIVPTNIVKAMSDQEMLVRRNVDIVDRVLHAME